MIKKELTYEDFDGKKITETLYFHLTKPELVELEVSYKEGLEVALNKMMQEEDRSSILAFFKKLVLLSYGIRAEDGKRFMKSEEISRAFSETNAYNDLYMLFFTDGDEATKFIKGILPSDLSAQVTEAELQLRMIEADKKNNTVDPTTLTTAEIAERRRQEEEAAKAQD